LEIINQKIERIVVSICMHAQRFW